ncbi:MAG: GNAT family N-acyltransferase, partial [Bacteroidales bacterium]
MEKIIDPVAKELIVKELKDEFLLRHTNKADNLLYIITAQQAPNTMREIGRLREEAFRLAGGGSGMEVDIDEADTMEYGYKQLIVWNPENQEIMGGYRFILGKDVKFDEQG